MKKNGLINGLIKIGILAASIGGTIYLLKDKISECPKCRESLDKAKAALKNLKKDSADEDDSLDYTEDFQDDLSDVEELDEILDTPADREYVSIHLTDEPNTEADEDGVTGTDALFEEEEESPAAEEAADEEPVSEEEPSAQEE